MDSTAIEQEIYDAIRRVKPSLETMALTPLTRFDELGLESLERTIVRGARRRITASTVPGGRS